MMNTYKYPLPAIGQLVNARKRLINDLREDGMGIEICCERGDDLYVREIKNGYILVSHYGILDRSFCVDIEEIDYIYPESVL